LDLPVGYFQFHKDPFFNYQLNRWNSLGYTRREDLDRAGSRIKTFDDYISEFTALGEEAVQENRLRHAAFYFRAAEFLVAPTDEEKLPRYEQFRELFDRAFADEAIERYEVPYAGGFLPAMRLPSRSSSVKGVVLAFGGFDSFIEEFYSLWTYLAEAGYEVIAFEGPGQGGALRRYGLAFDHDWEKPTSAVLDYFGIPEAALIGVSMGGYWAIRAAAFEKRITGVIAFPPVYDWMEMAPPFTRKLVDQLVKRRKLMNFLVRLKMTNAKLRHTVHQALFLVGKDEPVDAVLWMLGMNKEHIHFELVEQDVLLLGGENDSFQPPKLLHKQAAALVNARSVTSRIFTKEEHADQHCQMGNLGLALAVMVDWLDKMGENRRNESDAALPVVGSSQPGDAPEVHS
jgi:pimeloyl-ACP methyl ester carboxylesterase